MFNTITHYDQLLLTVSASWQNSLIILLSNIFNSMLIWLAVIAICLLVIQKLSFVKFLPYLYGFLAQILFVYLLKLFIARPRPFEIMADLQIKVLHLPNTFSFPSAHTANAVFLAGLLAYVYPKYRWCFYSGTALLGLLRVYSGVHYVSDVVAGYVVGLLLFIVTQSIIQRTFDE